MSKIVLIDGHSILNRAFYGVPDLTNAKGLHTNAVYGFLNILFKILEEELQKLATEKAHVEKQKAFYSRVTDYETNSRASERAVKESNIVKGELFFSGVGSKQSLKKRYKDLIKIYHPDNLDGDTDTIQEINSEYNKLCALYEI